ncbi:uncharacterized protein LOC135695953 [Rhopilema esculentum]|uniref:uncharacterized protein LOC135695953 n=1 Tax=Rhopilema esculentum TaxID=499914 RepID=UPI0031E407B9
MSSSESDVSNANGSYDYESEENYAIEVEGNEEIGAAAAADVDSSTDDDNGLLEYDPVADEEYVQNYERAIQESREEESILSRRFEGIEQLDSWCKCGNCAIDRLANARECKCCTEIKGCISSLTTVEVRQDIGEQTPTCVVEHPGFKPVCLNKWSLGVIAQSFKKKDKTRYKRTGFENKFLRSISDRSFTRLIHGRLGNKRIPLPACAYNAIRQEFPVLAGNAKGFESNSSE